ncbi:MAG: c-type cytochrome [Chloroflexi bacterium]|nr:c-type cytochrome [Chloroflexota bacterium]
MNTKQKITRLIEFLFGILATEAIVFAILFYAFEEPTRLVSAQNEILQTQVDDAMTLYAENCAVCHGLAGEGIGATPSLDNDGLRTMDYDELVKIIARGRYETAMPAWNKTDGGPLSDYQIGELAALIQSGDWNATRDRVVNLGLAPLVPFETEPDPVIFEQIGALTDGAVLQQAVTLFATECVACHGADGLGTSLAPALNDPLVREKAADELTRIITLGTPGTLMAGWSSTLAEEEIAALVTLVTRWDEVPLGAIPAPDVPVPTTAESLALGEELFAANCSRCHGPEGQGTPRAPALNVKSFLTETSDLAIQQIVTQGVPGTAMPAWGDRMTEADIQAIVGFIRQWEATAPEVATPARGGGGGPPWLRSDAPADVFVPPGQQTDGAAGQAADPQAGATDHREGSGAGGPPDGYGGGGVAAGGEHTAGEVPPWAQEQVQPAWWETLDQRVLVLVFSGVGVATLLIFVGYVALRRNPPSDGE